MKRYGFSMSFRCRGRYRVDILIKDNYRKVGGWPLVILLDSLEVSIA